MQIISNQIKCNKCGTEVFSAFRHDFNYCKCKAVAVDGGMDYLRRIGDREDYTDQSIIISSQMQHDIEEKIKWCRETGRNEFGLVCAIFRVLRDHGAIDIEKPLGLGE